MKSDPVKRPLFGRMFGRKSLQDGITGSVTLTPRIIEVIRNAGGTPTSYDELYRTVSSVRTVVDMLSMHFAQVGLKLFRRVNDVDRREESSHPAAATLSRPSPDVPAARFMRESAVDYFVHANCYWYMVEADGVLNLLRLPPSRVQPRGGSITNATEFLFYRPGSGEPLVIPKIDIVHFRDDPDPADPRIGLSRLAALRGDLVEGLAASRHMTNFWRNAARHEGVIERPLAAPDWSDESRERFEKSWSNRYAGDDNAGKTAVLEEGMTLNAAGFSPQQAQLMQTRIFNLEAVARGFGMPIALLGLGESAGYGSSVELHAALYQDTLGPHFKVFEDEIRVQYLPRFANSDGLYVEFNLEEKLAARFEDKVASLSTAVGNVAWMTPDEARARVNLPQRGDAADELYGNPGAAPLGATPPAGPPAFGASASPLTKSIPAAVVRQRRSQKATYQRAMREFFDRQARTVTSRLGAKNAVDDAWDEARWNRELADMLVGLNGGIARTAAANTARQLRSVFDRTHIVNYLSDNAQGEAKRINNATFTALKEPDADAAAVFDIAKTSRSEGIALTAVTAYNAFGRHEAARQAGKPLKSWIVTSGNSRHPEMDGETVPLDKTFSNGGMWPGDPGLPTEETARCECALDF